MLLASNRLILAPVRLLAHPFTWYAAGLVCSFVALYQALGSAPERQVVTYWLNSDSLFPGHVGKDLLLDGYGFSGWRFPVANFLFPDVLLASTCTLAVGQPALANFVYGALQLTLLTAGFVMCCRVLRLSHLHSGSVVLAAVAITLLTATQFGEHAPAYAQRVKSWGHVDLHPLHWAFIPQLHTGAYVVAVWCAALGLWLLREGMGGGRGRITALAFVVLCTLGAFSDLMFVAQFVLALSATCVLAAFVDLVPWRRVLPLIVLACVGGVLGAWLNQRLLQSLDPTSMGGFSVETAVRALRAYAAGFLERHGRHWDVYHWMATCWLAVSLGAFLIAVRRQVMRHRHPETAEGCRLLPVFLLFLGLSALLSAAAIIGGGHAYLAVRRDYAESMKYQHPLFLGAVFGWALLAAVAVNAWFRSKVWARVAVWAGALLAVAAPLSFLADPPAEANPLATWTPPYVRFLDEHARQFGLKDGVTDFWNARPVTLFSKKGVRAFAATPDFQPQHHLGNTHWHRNDPRRGFTQPFFNFLIRQPGSWGPSDPIRLQWAFGRPAVWMKAGELWELWVYNRPTDIVFRDHFFEPSKHTPIGTTVRISADKLPGRTGVVEGTQRVARQGQAAGLLSGGPHLPLPPGRYHVTVRFAKAEGGKDGKPGHLEVGCFEGGAPLRGGATDIEDGREVIQPPVVVVPAGPIRPLEVRVFYDGTGTLAVQDLTVTRVE
ncbi:MAG: hypothetical protein L0Z62_11475 [Gemmataceae bacterium]|nr:hypothetical protein [Gemmataceae bacterium]